MGGIKFELTRSTGHNYTRGAGQTNPAFRGNRMLNFIGFAFIVQLLLAIAFAMFQDVFTRHSQEVGRVLRLPTRSELLARTLMAKVLHWIAVDYRRRARAAPVERLQPFGNSHPADPTHLAVFVRGTFGAPGYDKRWNQVETTLKGVHPRTAFFCFYWPGHNGERARRADGAALAEALAALAARHPGRPILAVGHSHGGTVIEHASRTLSGEVPLVPILLAAPTLQYDEKLADHSHAHLTALLYASAVLIPALLLHLIGWALWLLGQPALQHWNVAWFEPLGIAAVVAVFALRPAARRAREILGTAPPAPRHMVRHIWCRGDEVFDMFTRADAVRVASDMLREAWHDRLERLLAEPWVRIVLFELVACVLCWTLLDASVRELARSDPANAASHGPRTRPDARHVGDACRNASEAADIRQASRLPSARLDDKLGVVRDARRPGPTLPGYVGRPLVY